ncbi:hypothetical protein N7495_005217 [Penicillium taxi]|uniref:uncharacterized protein n=1 Tax=Penicillium taxi TaxID=168475 RepID=UPI0025459FFD|nr:uncharacterized protein N7495_005217 [Penicillium taxi]KAJ5893526.1 hypothetical protein N7495_005217 [Penicillium taxi]
MNGEVPPRTSGANVAFLASRNPPNVILPFTVTGSGQFNRHAQPRHHDMSSESGPEVGSVRDKIGRLTNSKSPAPVSKRVRPPPPPSPRPELLAARLAAEKSYATKQISAGDAARLGAMRSASRAQPRPPPRPATLDRPDIRAPIPIRPRSAQESVDSMFKDDITSSDSGPRYSPSLRSRAGSLRSQALNTYPSVSSRLAAATPIEDPKPRPPPRSMTSSVDYLRKPVLSSSSPSIASTSELSQRSSSSAVTSMADESNRIREEALSNAIIASALASSRASPATKLPPPPPRRRRAHSKSILQLAYPKSEPSRTPSPLKGMPQTLRGLPKPDDDEARRRHKMKLLHKHPHKHHEGDRKRWRREVTEKERKRYEGVWASNKGLHIPPSFNTQTRTQKWPPPSEMVLNLVVREIWSRSGLSVSVLEQVWDLVDQQHIGLLTKEEFVVGMWLIDQQLKGHKLPNKVPDSVWDSVRYVTGIKLSSTGR